MGKIFFVSGIDTGVGKSVVTGMMARFLLKHGVKTATVKVVQTGNQGFSEDLRLHRRLMGSGELPEDRAGWTAPQIFGFPASPHLAARLEHRCVDVGKITGCLRKTAEHFQVTLAEGAGGLAVPLTEELLTADFAAAGGFPVILVTSGKLGSLNHTLLSLEALKSRGMTLAGVVYNRFPGADPLIDGDTPRMIRRFLKKYGFPERIVFQKRAELSAPEGAEADYAPIFRELLP